MKSLRIEPELAERLERAAAAAGETLSEFIRKASAHRADVVLSAEPVVEWSDVIGVIHGGGGKARRSGAAFRELVGAKHASA